MLTRIEIDGFKSFEDFSVDMSPFTVVLGGNGTGKSNLFDAIQLLSRLATEDLPTSFQQLRGKADELFRRRSPKESVSEMRFAVEVLVEPRVRDPWGVEVELTNTRIRYELSVARQRDQWGAERLVVMHERAASILKKDDRWRPFGAKPSKEFARHYLRSRSRGPWIETVADDVQRSFIIHPDGHAGRILSKQLERTVLSSVHTGELPHLFALREEMRSWRFLQLNPASMRRPSPITAPEAELLPDGSNLAGVLAYLKLRTTGEHHPQGILADISASLASIIPGVLQVEVEEDDYMREYHVWVELSDGFRFPTRVLSDPSRVL